MQQDLSEFLLPGQPDLLSSSAVPSTSASGIAPNDGFVEQEAFNSIVTLAPSSSIRVETSSSAAELQDLQNLQNLDHHLDNLLVNSR